MSKICMNCSKIVPNLVMCDDGRYVCFKCDARMEVTMLNRMVERDE